ncbi:MAG: glycosyltransferase [Thermoleophilaceae bacterium]|nr:glycosyltransferase [Thermoleophilaceae bacterium]
MTRILHAPADVGGNALGLSRAERELGFESDVAVVAAGPFGYQADILFEDAHHPPLARLPRRVAFLRRAAHRYDIFHFNFGQTLLTVRAAGRVWNELAWLKRRGRTVVVTFQGCDVRPQRECSCSKAACTADDRYRPVNAERIARFADRVLYLNPDLARWLPRAAAFMPYASVDARAVEVGRDPGEPGELVVAHAPSDREVKGSAEVIAAVEALRAEGAEVRLDLIEGVPHDEVLARVGRAHVAVDQLNLGWYGALAVEAMATGRPVLCAIDDAANPFGEELPIVRARAGTLLEELRTLAGDPDRRRALGERSRRFALERHDPRAIARDAYAGLVELP